MSNASNRPSNQANASTAHHKQGIVLAGLDRAQMIDDLIRDYPADVNGFSVPIFVIDADQARVDAVAASDLPSKWGSRVQFFAGPSCIEDLCNVLNENLDCYLPRHIVATGNHTVSLAKQMAAKLDALVRQQTQRTESLYAQLADRWKERGYEYWEERYRQIAEGSPARVLVVTTRFSTFIRHSADDLAESFGDLGHDARLLMEPNTHTNITPTLCLQTIEDFDPDLIVVINFPRDMHRELFPDGCPHVCWIQDAMPHLFRTMERSPSPLDFVVGHIYSNAAGLRGYLPEACLEFPVPVSESKFHATPVDAKVKESKKCDIAYVSHQSQTPEAFDREFTKQFNAQQLPAFVDCRAAVQAAMENWYDGDQHAVLVDAQHALAKALNHPADGAVSDLLWNQYIHPLAERIIRHQTLHWASEIASVHNLDFRIFGNGWHDHPTLNQHNAGPLPHGQALRECYQSAAVHLHASMLGVGHQRVFECALSGGLPLVRRSWGEVYYADWLRMFEFINAGHTPDASLVKWKHPAYTIKNHPELQSILDDRARIKPPVQGWDHTPFEHVYAQIRSDDSLYYWDGHINPKQLRFLDILAEPIDLTFCTKDDLERCILRAINQPDWRKAVSAKIAQNASETLSMNTMAKQLLELVANRLTLPTNAKTLEPSA